jgi:2-methylfumaryl-CoA hydratase
VPELPKQIGAAELDQCLAMIPRAGKPAAGGCFEDYTVGQIIRHRAGMTIEEAEHASATRLYQNTAAVHFDGHAMKQTENGRRLMYGGHVISVARALQFDGLENAERILGWNAGTHANPTFAGDTIYAATIVLEVKPTKNGGVLRLQLFAVKNLNPANETIDFTKSDDGKTAYHPNVVLDLDFCVFMPNRRSA